MKYGFHYTKDKSREIIHKAVFPDKETAIIYFAETKNLSIDNFLKIYKVVLINDKP